MLEKPTLHTTWLPLGLAVIVLAIFNFGLYTNLNPQLTIPATLPFPYSADFSESGVANSYVPFGGDWEIHDEALVQLSTSGYDLGTVIPLSIPTDQTYQFDVTLRYIDGEHGGGILFNAQQPGTRQKSHMARFNTDGDAWWLIYGYFDDGSAFIGQGSVRLSIPPRDSLPHVLSVQVNNASYTLFVDGQVVAADIPLQYQGGNIGFITAATQVSFDDISAAPLVINESTQQAAPPAQVTLPTPAPVNPTTETTLYATAFNEQGDSSQWTTISGTWAFEPDAYVQTQTEGFDLSTALNISFNTPYRLRATFNHRAGNGGGVLFNLSSPNQLNEGYLARYFEDGAIFAWGYFDPNGGNFIGQGNISTNVPADADQIIEVRVEREAYTIRLNGTVIVENVPMLTPIDMGYIGLTASQSVVAFKEINVSETTAPISEATPETTFTNGINIANTIGDWQIEGTTVTQRATELTDYFAGTGLAAERFTLSVDIQLPVDQPQAGGGLVLHMEGRDDLRGGAMVRLGNGGSDIFWGEYNEAGVFAGIGGATLNLSPAAPITLAITVYAQAYDVRVNGEVVGENLPITRSQGWIGLLSFGGPVTFSNIQLTLGNE